MRKNVWKRFLAATLAAVVMFTSVDCSSLVVNAEGTTKTQGEVLADHYGFNSRTGLAVLTHQDLAANQIVYDYTAPTDLNTKIKLDVAAKTITADNYTKDGVIWTPSKVVVKLENSGSEEATKDGDVYTYASEENVTEVTVTYDACVEITSDEQLEVLNAPYYLKSATEEMDYILSDDDLAELADTIQNHAVPNLSLALSLFDEIKEDDQIKAAVEADMIKLPEDNEISELEEDINTVNEYFELADVFDAYESEDLVVLWAGYVSTLIGSVEDSQEAIEALAESETLVDLAETLSTAGELLNNDDAKKAGSAITSSYIPAFENYLENDTINDFDAEYLYASKKSLLVDEPTGNFEFGRSIGEYNSENITTNTFVLDTTEVTVEATTRIITVAVAATVIENNNKVEKQAKNAEVVVTLGDTAEVVKATAAEKVKAAIAEIDPNGSYGLGSYTDVYNLDNYKCTVNLGDIESNGVTEGTTISITYEPNEYEVKCTEDGADVTIVDGTVPYGWVITLPEATESGKSYEYVLNGTVYEQGDEYTVTGDVTFTRSQDKEKTKFRVNDIAVEDYADELTNNAKSILWNYAVASDSISVRVPDDSWISAELVDDTTNLYVAEYNAGNGYKWVPNKVIVKNGTEEVETIPADKIQNGVATITSETRDNVEVEYVLTVVTGDEAAEIVNTPYELVQSVQGQLADLATLVEYESGLAQINKALLEMISTQMNANSQAAIKKVVNEGCDLSDTKAPLILYKHLVTYKDMSAFDKIDYYYQNYEVIRAQIELLADQLAIIAEDPNLPVLKETFPAYAEKIDLLPDYAKKMGELKENHFEPKNDKILSDVTGYEDLMTLLVSSNTVVEKIEGVTELCITKDLSTSLPALPEKPTPEVKYVTVEVVVTDSNNQSRSKTDKVEFSETGLGTDGVEKVEVMVDELTEELGVDTVHYTCTVAGSVDENLTEDTTITYTWTPKTYTVKLSDETNAAYATQTFPYDNQKIKLVRPAEGYVYYYVINGEDVPVTYVSGSEYEEYSLKSNFEALFDEAGVETITITRREEAEQAGKAYVTVEVIVKASDDSVTDSITGTVEFEVTGLGTTGVQKVTERAENLAKSISVDTTHYICTVTGAVDENLTENATVTYTWTPKTYTVKLSGETDAAYATQTFSYDESQKIKLVRPSKGYVYTYSINGEDVSVEYEEGSEYVEYSLKACFEALFDEAGVDTITIERSETVKEAVVTVEVTVTDSSNNSRTLTGTVDFKATGLGTEGVEKVKALALELAQNINPNVEESHYTCTVTDTVDETLTENATVKYTWAPKTYTVKLSGETNAAYATQTFPYDNQKIKLVRPADGYRYYYDIDGQGNEKAVGYDAASEYEELSLKSYFTALFDEAGVDTITITRRQVAVNIDDKIGTTESLVQDLENVLDEETAQVIQFEDANGEPQALVVRLEGAAGEEGIALSIANTVLTLVKNYSYVALDGYPVIRTVAVCDENGDPVIENGIPKTKKELSLQAIIDAFCVSNIGTKDIYETFDENGKTQDTVEIKDGLVISGTSTMTIDDQDEAANKNLGAQIVKTLLTVGSDQSNTIDLDFYISYFADAASADAAKLKSAIGKVRNYVEITGKDEYLTVEVEEKLSKEAFEVYLLTMLLEGETDLANVNNVTLEQIVKNEYDRLVEDFEDKDRITIATLQNTLAKLGISEQDLDLDANKTVEKAINKALELYKNNGDIGSVIVELREDAIAQNECLMSGKVKTTSVLNTLNSYGVEKEYMDMLTSMLKEDEKNGYLEVRTKLVVDGIDGNYAALIINNPKALNGIDGLNENSKNIAVNALNLVTAEELNSMTIADNAMVIMLQDASKVTFAGNGILDLNGNAVTSVEGTTETVLLVDSTYNNTGEVTTVGKNVKDARITKNTVDGDNFYKVDKDSEGNLTVKLDAGFLAKAAEIEMPELKTLACEIAFDLLMNNISSGDMVVTGTNTYDIYDAAITDDIFEFLSDAKNDKTGLVNTLINIVNLGNADNDSKEKETEGLFGLINDILASLTYVNGDSNAFADLAVAVVNGSPIASYTVATNPLKVNAAVKGEGDGYITAGVTTSSGETGSKTFKVDFVVDPDSNAADKAELEALCDEMSKVVKVSDVYVDLNNIEVVDGDIVAEGAAINAILKADLSGNHDYAAVIAMIAAYGEKDPANSALKAGVEDYLKDGSIDVLRPAVENITTKQVISAVKNANGKTFQEIVDAMKLDGNADSVKALEAKYDDLFRVVYRLAAIVSNKLGINGDDSKLGSLQKVTTEKVGDVTYTYYSYGGDYEGSRQVNVGYGSIDASASGSIYADLLLTLFVEDDAPEKDDDNNNGGNSGNQGGSSSGSSSSGSSSSSDKEYEGTYYAPSTSTSTTGTQTGDANNAVLWISVMGIAIIAVVAAVAVKKRRTK
ncbi:MAG: hypothetical protein J6B94_07980 [Lachnospiraceae bacterium]|nr:hypothetical protein [Lachnospiraceae bacterium]